MMANRNASSGHKLGQLIGDWYEEYFVLPLLETVASDLDLYVDSRFRKRSVRSGKILWEDLDENAVDYDFVLELGGTDDNKGVPVAFIECFWRRGSRHSKDKARDDSGKLMPMRDTYPTARFLGIVSAGDFTSPARELVRSRDIDLFYVPKQKVVDAFLACGLVMDYPDKLAEDQKSAIVEAFDDAFDETQKKNVQQNLVALIGDAATKSYSNRVSAALSALPQEIRFIVHHDSQPLTFDTVDAATEFLKDPSFNMTDPTMSYTYQIEYSDGSEFEKSASDVDELRKLHKQIAELTAHMNAIAAT